MVASVSMVTCSAKGLVNHIAAMSPKVPIMLVRNGVHWERFQVPHPIPNEVAAVPRPRIGFVGSVSYWVNLELVAQVAELRPEWHFVFVGPQRQTAKVPPNVHFVPPVSPEEVPGCIQGFNVGLIPFYDTPLTRCVNPVKLYEYLACGKPVVATPYTDLEEAKGLVYLAETPTEFADAIERALSEDSFELQERRRNIAKQGDWANRAKEFLAALLSFE